MARRLVTIANLNEPTEAHILKGRLEAEGIQCFIGDEHIVAAQPFYSVAVGGVKLKVAEEDVEEARAILADIQEGTNEYDLEDVELAPPMQEHLAEAVTCPSCGSDHVKEERYSKTVFSLSYLLFGFPLPFVNKKYKCYNCSFVWKSEK
ncbi:DUF2007 domain-containing protein [Pontibacter sp. SGAir0037]|uniref:putative signal transducing protein n=1 Tax=Pontibacter sp. SGAir0037 TaxID=2571030 RepID=UPI0010CD6067|nr:DUF2007 domain-containing protein [Pontibacter sp. SGAir0037]QCR24711.1 DUF2007 domain-containing protein [Pontibacter sp. SGAir0037]